MAVANDNKVVKLEDVLSQNKTEEVTNMQKPKKKKTLLPESLVPKGKPKSGKVWKSEKKRFSSIIKTKGIRNSFEKKQALRGELARIKEASRAVVAEKAAAKELKKQRRRDNIKRTEENRKKSEVVQVITNTNKIKKMKKKQLRFIEKRDTTTVG